MAPAESAEREQGFSEQALESLERAYPEGIAMQQILDAFDAASVKLTEATFRKYVQLGLLPRSVRVGRKGKNKGSQGLYPATVVRRIDDIRKLMAQGYSMDEIQREFFFVRGDLEELARTLEKVWAAFEAVLEQRGGDALVGREIEDARALGKRLVDRLDAIEKRMSMRARMERAAV